MEPLRRSQDVDGDTPAPIRAERDLGERDPPVAGGWVEPYFSFHGLYVSTEGEPEKILYSDVDPLEYSVARRQMCRGDRVLVAGNGMGSVATLLAAEFGRETVIAFEPNPDLVAITQGWINFSGGPLQVYQGALGTVDTFVHMRLAKRWAESTLHPEILPDQRYTDEWVEVLMADTNRIIGRFGINALLLDVEGAEHDILPALDYRPLRWIVTEVHGTKPQADQLLEIVARNGLTCVDRKSNNNPLLWVVSASRA